MNIFMTSVTFFSRSIPISRSLSESLNVSIRCSMRSSIFRMTEAAMVKGTEMDPILPFESASELHAVHERLLVALDNQLGSDPSTAMDAEAVLRLESEVRQ